MRNTYIFVILLFAVLVSSGITFVLTKKGRPDSVHKTRILKDSIVSMGHQISEYKKTIQLANDYFLGKSPTDLEYFEQHSDTLIVTTVKNLQLYQDKQQADSVGVAFQVIVDTLIRIEKDIETEQELSQIKSELASVKEGMKRTEKTKGILSVTSSKGKKIKYIGEVHNGKANGYGEGIFETGSVYKGYWKDNLRHGKGYFAWEDQEYYKGDFVEGKREGYGVYHWKNGEVYKGSWENDMRHGKGTLYKKNGKVKQEGIWKNDELK